ncbi:MAG: SNF2-related protein, partial [Nitrosopumilus sp.]
MNDSHPELRPYQIRGIEFLKSRQSAFLADEQGLGKTVQVLKAVQYKTPCLIVCPNSSKYFWSSEIQKWLGVGPEKIYVYESWDRRNGIDLFGQEGVEWYIIHWEGMRYVHEQLGVERTEGKREVNFRPTRKRK